MEARAGGMCVSMRSASAGVAASGWDGGMEASEAAVETGWDGGLVASEVEAAVGAGWDGGLEV